jgi:glycosyltransferase involved in cell wall biosynthesis
LGAGSDFRILWFNWRDLRNPEAGGAEILTHEIAKRLIQKGNYDITLFTACFPGALPYENIDGINIMREGGKYTVYGRAQKFYRRVKDAYDIIIDEINVRPFLTPTYVIGKPVFALIHQIAPEQFLLELPFPLNYFGYYYLEKKWLSHYKYIPTITVSNSTRIELEKIGFKSITVIPQGLSVTPLSATPEKETSPTLVFIGRLKRHKNPDHAILAFSLVKKQLPDAKLWIIGEGYMRRKLEEQYDMRDITFYGYVDSQLKYELLSRAHVFVFPATREGWPLAILESNAMGTPVVGYNVPGLRDSVLNGETGVLVSENTPAELASSIISLLKDPSHLGSLSSNALRFSKQFSWDKSCEVFEKLIIKQVERSTKTE